MAKAPVNFNILLNQVNRIRTALLIGEGKLEALPPGTVNDSDSCVLARALSNGWRAEVNQDIIQFYNDKLGYDGFKKAANALCKVGFKARHSADYVEMKTTATMANFIKRFDEGDFPWLILDGGDKE